MKTFSVAMATYNGVQFLPEQLTSIADQSLCPDELVVVDDASDDGTVELLESFADSAPFPVRITTNSHNIGSTASFESAIASCSGEFIALADQDDLWLPDRLASTQEVFESFPRVGPVFCNAALIDAEGLPLDSRTIFREFGLHKALSEKRGTLDSGLYFSTRFVVGATLAFRSRYLEILLPIPSTPPGGRPFRHDAWIAALVSTQAEVFADKRVLVGYRQHSGQQVGIGTATGPSLRVGAGFGGR